MPCALEALTVVKKKPSPIGSWQMPCERTASFDDRQSLEHARHELKKKVQKTRQSATQWTASVHTLDMPKPNVTRVQSASEWTASVHTLHMPKPNVTRVQSATQWIASVHTLHMPKPNVTRVQSASEWTASVHALHMPKPNVTRVQSATQWIASVHTLHMPKPNVTRVQSASEWTASVHALHMPKPLMYSPLASILEAPFSAEGFKPPSSPLQHPSALKPPLSPP